MKVNKKSPADKWQQLKDVLLVQVNSRGKVFINPRRDPRVWQCGMEMVGKGIISHDGACFLKIS